MITRSLSCGEEKYLAGYLPAAASLLKQSKFRMEGTETPMEVCT
jgi:hypothetical protein